MEHPKRPLRIWSLDVGKQGTGMMAAHLCGMGAAILLAHIPFHQRSSECAWYVFTFLFDTCIGTGLSLALHWTALWAAARPGAPPALDPLLRALTPCGDYGEPASALRWVSQTLEWVFCVVLARGVCLGLAAAFSPLLGRLAIHLDAAFEGRPRLFLVFVMLVCPLLVNTAQVGCWWRTGKGTVDRGWCGQSLCNDVLDDFSHPLSASQTTDSILLSRCSSRTPICGGKRPPKATWMRRQSRCRGANTGSARRPERGGGATRGRLPAPTARAAKSS